MLHGPEERKYLRSDIKNPQNPGKEYFSIIAFSPEVTGIDEEGFSYSLKNGTLYNKESVGVSNEIMAKEATLRVKKGYLLVLITRDWLLFNSLSKLQTKPLLPIRHICAVAGEGELNRMRRFGDRSWCLLLTWEWLGAEGMIWPAIFWEQAENFYPLPQIPTTTIWFK